MSIGIYGSLPIIVLRVVDHYIGSGPFSQLSEKLKRSIAWLMLELSGVSVEIINGPDKSQKQMKSFSESCSLLTFSHSSNLDGFLVSATCPIRHFALAKKELFMVPFFSWISLAFGGVPVDRGNRERAVSALHRASAAAKNNQICIVIAPEGMRSTSGQLLPFKKGKRTYLRTRFCFEADFVLKQILFDYKRLRLVHVLATVLVFMQGLITYKSTLALFVSYN